MKEIWSQIPDHPDYEVSTSGNVRHVSIRRGKPHYTPRKRHGKTGRVAIDNKRPPIFRVMAQVFLNEGVPLTRKQLAVPKDGNWNNTKLANLQIVRLAPKGGNRGTKTAVLEYCQANTIDDLDCMLYVYDKTGVLLKLHSIQNYRASFGFKKKVKRGSSSRSGIRRQTPQHTS